MNQFDAEKGWGAYVAPTRALTAQITRRLRRDFDPIGVRVEQLTGAVEIDTFEEDLLTQTGESSPFAVLVSTPENLQLVIRNKKCHVYLLRKSQVCTVCRSEDTPELLGSEDIHVTLCSSSL